MSDQNNLSLNEPETSENRLPVPVVTEIIMPVRPITSAAPVTRVTTTVVQSVRYPKAPTLRRAAAEIIDRLLPLPFLAVFFWPWFLVVFAYDLFRDSKGASVGKRLMGLSTRIVTGKSAGQPCTPARSFLRNLGGCFAQFCYAIPPLVPLGLTYDVVETLLVLLSPSGRRIGDLISGTTVTAIEAIGTTKEEAGR